MLPHYSNQATLTIYYIHTLSNVKLEIYITGHRSRTSPPLFTPKMVSTSLNEVTKVTK